MNADSGLSSIIIGKSDKKKAEKKAKEAAAEEAKVKPSKAIGTYFFYQNYIIPKLKEDEKISHKEAMSKAGTTWHKLSEEEKQPFVKQHEEDVLR